MNVIKDNKFAPRGRGQRGRSRSRGRIGTLGGYDALKMPNVQPKYQITMPQTPLPISHYNASSSSTTTTPQNTRGRGHRLTSSSSAKSLSRGRTTDSEAGKCTTPGSRSDVEEKFAIMAITTGRGEARGEVGLAVMDIQHPHMVLCQLSDCNSFVNTLTKIYTFNPIEILLPETICDDHHNLYKTIRSRFPNIVVTGMARMHFNDITGLERIRMHCAKEYSSVELIIGRKYYALAAASALIMYIEFIQHIQYLPRTMRIEYQAGQNTTMIDIESAQSLELVTTNGGKSNYCLLGAMDRCSTPLGRRVLRASILQPPCDITIIRNRQKCIEELIGNRSLHELIKSAISRLSGVHRLLSFTMRQTQSDSVVNAERNLNYILLLKSTVDIIPELRAALDTVVAPFFVKVREDLEDGRFNAIKEKILSIIHPEARSVKGFTSSTMQRCFAIKSGISDMLDVTRKNYCEILDDMKTSVEKLAEKYHLPLSFGCTMALGYHIQMTVARNNHFKVEDLPEEFIQVQKKRNTVYMTTESLVVLGHHCQEASEDLYTLSNNLMAGVLNEVGEYVACLFLLSDNVAELDLVLSLAEISSIPDYVKPTFGSSLKVYASKHPVMDILGDEHPTPNDVTASVPYNFHTITGPNMSGKTIYLKQIVLLHIMAQIGCYVPATKAQFRIADRILCIIEVRDNIEMDASTFMLEIKKIQYILQSITPTSLVILDELCRSTTVEEGSSLAWTICEKLSTIRAFTFHATHFQYLLQMPELYPRITNHYMEVLTDNVADKRLTYTHQRKEGVSTVEHYGIALARATGFPAEILKNAEELLASLTDSSTSENKCKFNNETERLQAADNKWNHDCLAAMYEELEKDPAEVDRELLIELIKKLKVPPESEDDSEETLESATPKTPVKKSTISVSATIEQEPASKRILMPQVGTEPAKKLIKLSSIRVDTLRQPLKPIENNDTLSQKTSSRKKFENMKNPLTDPDSPLFMPQLPARNSKTSQGTFLKPDKPPPRSWTQVSRKSDVFSQASNAPHNFSPLQQNVSTPKRTCTQTSSSLSQSNREIFINKTTATSSSINIFKKHQDSTNRESTPFVQISPELSHMRHILKKYAEEPQLASTSEGYYEKGGVFFARSNVVSRSSTSTRPSGSQIDNFNITQESRLSIKSPDVSVSSEISAIASGSSFQLDEYVSTPNPSFKTASSRIDIDLVSFSSMDSLFASKEARRKEAEIFKKIEGSDFDEESFLRMTTPSHMTLSSSDDPSTSNVERKVMLTAQTSEAMSFAIDTLPLGLFIADDGRTLLVTDHDDSRMTAVPVTLIQQSNGLIVPPVKLINGSEGVNTSVIQLNFDRTSAPTNNQTTTLVLNSANGALSFSNNVSGPRVSKGTLVQDQLVIPAANNIILETPGKNLSTKSPAAPVVAKRSPGRPRKDAIRPPGAQKKCDICGETFQRDAQLRKHMESHVDEKPHRCPKCPESFNIPINFTLHMATHNTGDPKCPVCGRKFARMASLKSHLLLHEMEEHLFCKECEDAFPTKAQLESHLRLHDEKWLTDDVRKCKLCNEQFTQPALYRIHIREHYKLRTKILKQTKKGIIHKTVYKCKICLKVFQKPSQLLRHIRVHTGEKPYTCNICNRSFSQKSSLQIHTWKHATVRPFSCNYCTAKFNQKGNLHLHVQRVHNLTEVGLIYSCPHCSCFFKRMQSLSTHMKKMHSNRAEEAQCDSSTETGKSQNNSTKINLSANNVVDSTAPESQPSDILQQALNKSGVVEKAVQQDIEAKETAKNNDTAFVTILDRSSDGNLSRYITMKHRNAGATKWYGCNYCHKEFKKPSDLIRHIRVHTQEKPFKCSQCYRSFALKSTLKCHERIHGGQKSYTCGVCGLKFACSSSLKTHTRTHQSLVHCQICDKTFGSASILKSHMKVHGKAPRSKISADAEALIPQIVLEEPLLISDAGNKISIAQVQSKQNHVQSDKEDGARPHKCWVCPAAFRKISHLKQHYRRHTGERPYKCPTCDRRFTSNSVLKSHLQTHESDRPWHCNMCSATFSTQSSMKRHLVTHSNKRPFMCPYCHKTFKTTVNCRKHMKIHKTELAQQQLDKQKAETANLSTTANKTDVLPTLPVNLNLSEDITDNFSQTITTDFTQAFSEQFSSISNEKGMNLVDNSSETKIVNLPEVDNLRASQTLHADETGTVTISNYSGDQVLTPESIREIEETLNQQLFHLGMNLGLGSNLPRSMGDSDVANLESREPAVLNIIYDNSKELEPSDGATINSNMFSTNFDTFDMSQIALQSDSEMDIGINSLNSTSMASILPRSAQEEQRLIPVTIENNLIDNQAKETKHVVVVSSLPAYSELTKPVQSFLKYPKIIAKADTTDETDRLNLNGESNEPLPSISPQSVQFTCIYCSRNFAGEYELKRHLYVAHLALDLEKVDDHETTSNELKKENTLQCHMCFKKEYNVDSLKAHLKTHCGPKEFQCPECQMKFCTNGGLSRHVKMHSIKQLNRWNCTQCSKKFANEEQYSLHMKIHNPIDWATIPIEPDSSQKEDSTLSQSNLLNCMTVKSPPLPEDSVAPAETLEPPLEKKKYDNQCQYCPKTFRKPSDLVRHIRTHTGERPYQCEHCDKSFAVKCTLDCHLKVHTGNEKFCCNVCNRLFATKGSLKVHMRLHTGVKPFTCHLCNLQFRTSGHRKVHLATHDRENERGDPRPRAKKKVSPPETVSVEDTNKTTKNDESIADATSQFTSLETITIDTSGISDQLTFNADGTIINNPVLSVNGGNQFMEHLQFLIDNGLVTVQTDESLLAPLNTIDNTTVAQDPVSENSLLTPQDTVACNPTDNLMSTQLNIEENDNQVHLPLEDCLEVPTNPASSRLPVKTARSAVKNQVKECDICGKSFAKVSQLVRHRRTHTGEKPFKCCICPKSFAQKSTREIHHNTHIGDRPFACPHCDFTFTQKWNLQTHLKRVHPLNAPGGKKLRRGQQIVSAKIIQDNNLSQNNKIPNLDDISFVELLK